MSMITKRFRVGGVLTDMTSVLLSDPTGSFGVRRTDTGAVVVPDGTAMNHDATGVYSLTFVDPADDLTYEYWLEFVYGGETYHLESTFAGPASVSAYLAAAIALGEKYCGRAFEPMEHHETYSGDATGQLFLRNFPVLRVDLVEFRDDDNEIDETYARVAGETEPEGFRFEGRTGEVRLLGAFPRGFQNIEFTYFSGFGTVAEDGTTITVLPAALERALDELATYIGKTAPAMKSERLLDYSYTALEDAIPPKIRLVLNLYKDVHVRDEQ